MKVAVTGATGFTGRRVVAQLVERGHEVRALVRPPLDRMAGTRVETIAGDLADPNALRALCRGREALVFVASLASGYADAIVEAAEATGVERAVYFSSTSLFTRLPAASKPERIRADARVRASSCDWTILRPTMIYGDEGDRNLSRMIRFLSRAPIVPLPGGGRALIQPVHVEDLGRAAVDALESETAIGREYELSGGEASPLRALVKHVLSLLGSWAPIVPLPIEPTAWVAGVWSALGLPPRVSPEQVRRLAEDKAFPFERAGEDFGYTPRSWREGLAAEVERLREIGWIR